MRCDVCEFPGRVVWPANRGRKIQLKEICNGNWITLLKCNNCLALWVEVPHEPYAMYSYHVHWKYSVKQWHYINDIDNSNTLHQWHNGMVNIICLPMLDKNDDDDDAKAVQAHYTRASGQAPFNKLGSGIPNLDAILENDT